MKSTKLHSMTSHLMVSHCSQPYPMSVGIRLSLDMCGATRTMCP